MTGLERIEAAGGPFMGLRNRSPSGPAGDERAQDSATNATNAETAVTKKEIENRSIVFKLSSTICTLRLLVNSA